MDYCKGLGAYGCPEAKSAQLVKMCSSDRIVPFIEGHWQEGDELRRILHIDLNGMVSHWRQARLGRVRDTNIVHLDTELRRMIFCLLYFIGFDPRRSRGGPVLSTTRLLTECTDVFDFLSGTHKFNTLTFVEEHPDREARCNPLYVYPRQAAERIAWSPTEGSG